MLKTSFHTSELDTAHMYIFIFLHKFEELYGIINMNFNVHFLIHLKKCILFSVLLWGYYAFPFEPGNVFLLKLIMRIKGNPNKMHQNTLHLKVSIP